MSKSVTKAFCIKELVKLDCKDSSLSDREQRIENTFYEYVVILWVVFIFYLNCSHKKIVDSTLCEFQLNDNY